MTATAHALAPIAEVTIITTDRHEEAYASRRAAGGAELPPETVQVFFLPDPTASELRGFFHPSHRWSAQAYEALKDLYPDGGPDLVEFPDFGGEGGVTLQAKRTADRALRNTTVCLRLYTTDEIGSVLDGWFPSDFGSRAQFELERYALRHADAILWPGGDVLGTYERYYGAAALAPATLVRHPTSFPADPSPPALDADASTPLRLIYVGRLERRKGVHELIDATRLLENDDWLLTIVGADTNTGALGTSVRTQLDLMAGGDPRIRFAGPATRAEVLRQLVEHDVAVLPSRWECWPNVALEAYHANRPIVATRTGGFTELVEPAARSGWLMDAGSSVALAEVLNGLLDDRTELERIVADGTPRARLDALTDVGAVRDAYTGIVARGVRRRPSRRSRSPLVSAVVPYFEAAAHVEDTVRSLCEQTHGRIEVIVVNDGSFRNADWALGELAVRYPVQVITQPNLGLAAARNTGILAARGSYIFPLDADNVARPTFVERCIAVLEGDPSIAYVSAWAQYVDKYGNPWPAVGHGYHPLGNEVGGLERGNLAGDAAAVIRRSVFEAGHRYEESMTSYEDWLFYRQLAHDGLYGHVIPERLIHYRVRADSLLRTTAEEHDSRLREEMEAHLRAREVEWVCASA